LKRKKKTRRESHQPKQKGTGDGKGKRKRFLKKGRIEHAKRKKKDRRESQEKPVVRKEGGNLKKGTVGGQSRAHDWGGGGKTLQKNERGPVKSGNACPKIPKHGKKDQKKKGK